MREPVNIDNLLVAELTKGKGAEPFKTEVQEIEDVPQESDEDVSQDVSDNVLHETTDNAENVEDKEEIQQETVKTDTKVDESDILNEKETKSEAKEDTDDYGNPVAKPRLYTEEELNQRIRDRLSRGRYAEQPIQQPVQQSASETTHTDDSWEAELKATIRQTMQEEQQTQQQVAWQKQEQAKQAAFEEKFTSGMAKYKDFNEVVAGKPLTDTMLLAARNLENPAAFVYAAAKTQAKELERIAQIPDALVQAAEIGKLEERMRKARVTAKTGKPIAQSKGDMTIKDAPKGLTIDQRIAEHAKRKVR